MDFHETVVPLPARKELSSILLEISESLVMDGTRIIEEGDMAVGKMSIELGSILVVLSRILVDGTRDQWTRSHTAIMRNSPTLASKYHHNQSPAQERTLDTIRAVERDNVEWL